MAYSLSSGVTAPFKNFLLGVIEYEGRLAPSSQSSSQWDFHPKALTEPYVNLSVHTALINHK